METEQQAAIDFVPAERGLTSAQLAAVTAAAGPLSVVAGPGTGKTTVLAGRVAYLVRTRGVDPASAKRLRCVESL
ncbi:MAG TPA: UvrD-helicase domain-containing protein [Chloroflexota bacterium]|jgi:superfamily I DNA/RNA helicase